jgi:pimeloyl-ACP methyl ester carboxylesterase
MKIKIYNSEAKGIPIIFLPGFNMRIKDYTPFLSEIKNKKIYVIGAFESRPRIKKIEDYIELLEKTISQFKIKKFYLIGHSLGGGTAMKADEKIKPEKILAINPLLEVDYKYSGYIKRFFKMAKTKLFKRFLLNSAFAIRAIFNAYPLHKLLKDIENFKLKKINTPTLILIAKKDEFFSTKNIQKQKFKNLTIKKTNGRHFNLVTLHKKIAKLSIDFLNAQNS